MSVDPVKGGIYKHYKGGLYQVIGLSVEVDSNKICVVEVAEATEEVRKGTPPIYQCAATDPAVRTPDMKECWNSQLKPEGEAIELADLCIRIADWFGWKKWDLDYVVTYGEVKGISALADAFYKKPVFNPLDHHLQMVEMICQSTGVNEPVNLGKTFRLVVQYFKDHGWDLEEAIQIKMTFNKTRSYRHGGKRH